jgi:hypothetical protein
MNLYEPKQLADNMRVVRKNTIAIAVAGALGAAVDHVELRREAR